MFNLLELGLWHELITESAFHAIYQSYPICGSISWHCGAINSNGMDDRYLVDPLLHLAVKTGVLSTSQILVYSNVHGRRAGEA